MLVLVLIPIMIVLQAGAQILETATAQEAVKHLLQEQTQTVHVLILNVILEIAMVVEVVAYKVEQILTVIVQIADVIQETAMAGVQRVVDLHQQELILGITVQHHTPHVQQFVQNQELDPIVQVAVILAKHQQ